MALHWLHAGDKDGEGVAEGGTVIPGKTVAGEAYHGAIQRGWAMKTIAEILNEAVKMKNLFPTRLDAKVAAVNKVNRLALDVLPHFHAAITPFIGKVIQNQGGDLQKRFRDVLPNDDCQGRGGYCLQWYYKASDYGLRAEFQTSCCAEHGSERAEVSITLAELDAKTLKALCSVSLALRTDYTVEWVRDARRAADDAERAAREADSKLTTAGFQRFNP